MTEVIHDLPVRDAMTAGPVVADGLTSVSDALGMMRARNISSLVVERRNDRDEHGMVLVADIARAVVEGNRSPSRTHLYEVMTKPAPTIDAEMNARYAIRQMQRFSLTHALVMQGRTLVGIVTLRDLVMRCLSGPGKG